MAAAQIQKFVILFLKNDYIVSNNSSFWKENYYISI